MRMVTYIILKYLKRADSISSFYDLYVYRKIQKNKIKWFKKVTYDVFDEISDGSVLISTCLDVDELKFKISKILKNYTNSKVCELKGWDGFVGDVPTEIKIAFMRASKLNNILEK